MAKKRTKKQKLKANKSRKITIKTDKPTTIKAEKSNLDLKVTKVNSNDELKVQKNLDEISSKTRKLLASPIKFIYQDLFKTALVTAIIIVVLVILAIYY